MTNEEAIKKLRFQADGLCHGCVHPSMVGWCENHCQLPQAFEMAIKALEQPEPCEDAVSRQYLLDAFGLSEKTRKYGGDHSGYNTRMLYEIQDVIEGAPSAQPEIIRCRECRNWIPGIITDKDDFIPPKCGKYQQMVGHGNDDFCSLAERREDG